MRGWVLRCHVVVTTPTARLVGRHESKVSTPSATAPRTCSGLGLGLGLGLEFGVRVRVRVRGEG